MRGYHAQGGQAVEAQVVAGAFDGSGHRSGRGGVGHPDPNLGRGERTRAGFHLHPHGVSAHGCVARGAHHRRLDVGEGLIARAEDVGRPGSQPHRGRRKTRRVTAADPDDHRFPAGVEFDGAPAGGQIGEAGDSQSGERFVTHRDRDFRRRGQGKVQGHRLEAEPGGDVRGGRDFGGRRGIAEHDAGPQPVGDAVPVRVGDGPSQFVEGGERLRLGGRRTGDAQEDGKTQNNGRSTHFTASLPKRTTGELPIVGGGWRARAKGLLPGSAGLSMRPFRFG